MPSTRSRPAPIASAPSCPHSCSGLPFVVGTVLGSPSLALFGMIFVFAAGGDLLVLWLIRGVDARALVQDHPSRAGCIVLPLPPG